MNNIKKFPCRKALMIFKILAKEERLMFLQMENILLSVLKME